MNYKITYSDEYLAHHGILGQKWGVRRFRNEDGTLTEAGKQRYEVKTRNGDSVYLDRQKEGMLARFLGRRFKGIRDQQSRTMDFDIADGSGKKLGHLFLYKESPDELNVNWIDISKKHRGKGYASSVMGDVVKYAKKNNYKKLTLEVPGDSPDARHIYEKIGFRAIGSLSDDDDVWGGLTKMELDLTDNHVSHSAFLAGYKITYSDDYLAHHGIKGQEWGRRRFQNEDGTYTQAGRDRYGFGDNVRAYMTESVKHRKNIKSLRDDLRAARGDKEKTAEIKRKIEHANEDYRDRQIESKLSRETSKSKSRLKLEEKYKAKGMNDKEAAIAAYRHQRLQKALVAAGAVAATAAVAYAIKKHHDYNTDKIIESGTLLSRVTPDDSQDVRDVFYAVFDTNKSDKSKYEGWYAKQLKGEGVNNVNVKKLSVDSQTKLASPKAVTDHIKRAIESDPSIREDLEADMAYVAKYGASAAGRRASAKGLASLRAGKFDENVYNAFNITSSGESRGSGHDKVFDALRKSGYSGMMDVNDMKFSGYRTKAPVIMFNKSNVTTRSVKSLTDDEINSSYAKSALRSAADQYLKLGVGAGALSIASRGINNHLSAKQQDAVVSAYREEHPNTKLSYKEIVRMEEESREKQAKKG